MKSRVLVNLLLVVVVVVGDEHQSQYSEPASYSYTYSVQDPYSGVDFDANEKRDESITSGQYRVQLPDGRTQIVTYTVADAYSGYVADVKYEGVARFDDFEKKSNDKTNNNDFNNDKTNAVYNN